MTDSLDSELFYISRSSLYMNTSNQRIYSPSAILDIQYTMGQGAMSWYNTTYGSESLRLNLNASPIFSSSFQNAIRFDSLVGIGMTGANLPTSNLHVIGLANITPGPTTSNISVGGTLCEYTNDGSSVGTSMTTLYTTSGLVNTANLLSRVGDRLKGVFAGYFTGDPTSTKSVHLYYGGNDLFGTTAITYSGTTYWRVEFTILRYSISTQIRHEVTITTYDTSTGESKIEQTSGAYGGFDFTSDMAIELKGQSVGAGTIDGDVISRMGYIDYNPAKI